MLFNIFNDLIGKKLYVGVVLIDISLIKSLNIFMCSSVTFRFFLVSSLLFLYFRVLVHHYSIFKSSLYIKAMSCLWCILLIFSPSLLCFDFAYGVLWSWKIIFLFLCGQIRKYLLES